MFFHQALLYSVLRVCTIVGVFDRPNAETLKSLTSPVLIVGMLFGTNIIANNASLIFVSLSLNQCLKAGSPLLMIAVAWMVEGKKTRASAAAAAVVTTVGSLLVVLHNPGFDVFGVALVGVSTLAAAFQYSAASITMRGKTNLVVHTTMYSALVVCYFCLPLILFLELDNFHDYSDTHSMSSCLGMLLLGGSMATAYLLVTNGLIALGGSVYLAVLGNAKLALVVLVSCYIFDERLTTMNVLGIVVTILGFFLYTWAKQRAAKQDLLQKRIEQIYRDEELTDEEEQQSLLQSMNTPNGPGHRGHQGAVDRAAAAAAAGTAGQKEARSTWCTMLVLEMSLTIFIYCMAVAIVVPPRHRHQIMARAHKVASNILIGSGGGHF